MKGGRKRVKGEGVSERTIERENGGGCKAKQTANAKSIKKKENIEKRKGGAERHNERGRKRETIVAIGRESVCVCVLGGGVYDEVCV